MRVLPALLLLAACYRLAPETRKLGYDDAMAAHGVVIEWSRHNLPLTIECTEALRTERVAVVGDVRFERLCYRCSVARCDEARCPLGCAYSCLADQGDGFALWADSYPTAVIYETAPLRAALQHETAHLLSRCALNTPDISHRNARIWGPGGVVEEARLAL